MISEDLVAQYESEGAIVVPSVLARSQVAVLKSELKLAIVEDMDARPDVFDKGMVHNCMFRGRAMASVLENQVMNEYLSRLLSPTSIIYAYQSSSAPPGASNYGGRIHVDSPRFISGYRTNMGVIFPLDDFTKENGGTLYCKGSHKREELPQEKEFYERASVITCSAGDMIVFDARLVHATGVNSTSEARHALTINFCRSYMRQRFDFCRMEEAQQEHIKTLNMDGKRLLGMNVRMPVSLDEFYLPESERLYKPGQG